MNHIPRVANLLCAEVISASYPHRDGLEAWLTGLVVSASCTQGTCNCLSRRAIAQCNAVRYIDPQDHVISRHF